MNRIPVVVAEDIGINRIEHLRSERLAGLNFGVGTRLKIGERSLSVKAASEFIQIGAQQIRAFTAEVASDNIFCIRIASLVIDAISAMKVR